MKIKRGHSLILKGIFKSNIYLSFFFHSQSAKNFVNPSLDKNQVFKGVASCIFDAHTTTHKPKTRFYVEIELHFFLPSHWNVFCVHYMLKILFQRMITLLFVGMFSSLFMVALLTPFKKRYKLLKYIILV